MARKEIVTFVDDIDGSEAVETVRFGLDNKAFEIDLNADNATRLREALGEFIEKARRGSLVAQLPARPRAARGAQRSATLQRKEISDEIRTWAREQGMTVKTRGRIPADVSAAYWIAKNGGNAEVNGSGVATPEFVPA